MTSEFNATNSSSDVWSNPANWVSGKVPHASHGLMILAGTNGEDDLGTTLNPFHANDIIGAQVGVSYPDLTVSGFLIANNVNNLAAVAVSAGGSLDVRHNLENVNAVSISSDRNQAGAVEIGGDAGASAFHFDSFGELSTLILDKPAQSALANLITFSAAGGKMELGGLNFDHASYLPNFHGTADAEALGGGKIQLTDHGAPVYQLSNVFFGTPGMGLSVGMDAKTGHDFILVS
jgi:hypothetical protein